MTSLAAAGVVSAWTVPGPAPEVHAAEQERLRRDWPVLARAVEALVRESAR